MSQSTLPRNVSRPAKSAHRWRLPWRADLSPLSADNRRWLRFHERAGWWITLCCLLVYIPIDLSSTWLFAEPLAQALWRIVLLGLVGAAGAGIGVQLLFQRVVPRLRAAEEASAEREEAAKLQGALLAAQTVQHHLSNQLALTTGYAELLALDPRLDPDLRALAHEASAGARQAVAALDQLQRLTRLEREALAGPTVLRLGCD